MVFQVCLVTLESTETEVKAIIHTAGLSWRELERNLLEDMEL